MQPRHRRPPFSHPVHRGARAFDHAIAGYLSYRADAMQRVVALLDADPDCGMAHVLKGYFAMLAFKQAALPMAQQAASDAARLLAGATRREQAHLAALQAWEAGEAAQATSIWDADPGGSSA